MASPRFVNARHNYVPLAADLFHILEDGYGWQSLQVEQFAETFMRYAVRMQHDRAMGFISERMADVRTDRANRLVTRNEVLEARREALRDFEHFTEPAALVNANNFTPLFAGVSADGRDPPALFNAETLAWWEGEGEEVGEEGEEGEEDEEASDH